LCLRQLRPIGRRIRNSGRHQAGHQNERE
jgi:hypothetical protein